MEMYDLKKKKKKKPWIQISHKFAKTFNYVQYKYNVTIQFQNNDSHLKVTSFLVVSIQPDFMRKCDYITEWHFCTM